MLSSKGYYSNYGMYGDEATSSEAPTKVIKKLINKSKKPLYINTKALTTAEATA